MARARLRCARQPNKLALSPTMQEGNKTFAVAVVINRGALFKRNGFAPVDLALAGAAQVPLPHKHWHAHDPTPSRSLFHPRRPGFQQPAGVLDIVPRLGIGEVLAPRIRPPDPACKRIRILWLGRPAINRNVRVRFLPCEGNIAKHQHKNKGYEKAFHRWHPNTLTPLSKQMSAVERGQSVAVFLGNPSTDRPCPRHAWNMAPEIGEVIRTRLLMSRGEDSVLNPDLLQIEPYRSDYQRRLRAVSKKTRTASMVLSLPKSIASCPPFLIQ